MMEVSEKTVGVLNKIRVFLDRGPEYNWYVSSYRPDMPPPGELQRIRHNSTMPNTPMFFYGLINGILIILQTAWALGEKFETHKDLELAGLSAEHVWFAHLMFSYVSFMALFDRKWYAAPLDALRVIGFVSLIDWYAGSSINPILWNLVLIHAAASLLTLALFNFRNPKSKRSSKKQN